MAMLAMPVPCDVYAPCDPDLIEFCQMIEKAFESNSAAGSAD